MSTTTTAKTTAKKAPATKATAKPTVEPHTTGAYRGNPEWVTAHAAATAASKGAPAYRAALQVVTHLAWKAPTSAVAWHKGTNATMLATAEAMGITTGQPVQEAMRMALGAAAKVATTPEQQDAVDNLVALVGPPAK